MLLTKAKIENYKSFRSSGEFNFTAGFNVIVGENNAGKTALIEALSLDFEHIPHRSSNTVPYRGATVNSASIINITFKLDKDELENILIDKEPQFHIPISNDFPEGNALDIFYRWYERLREIKCIFQSKDLVFASLQGYPDIPNTQGQSAILNFTRGRTRPEFDKKAQASQQELIPYRLALHLRERIYTFRAERFKVGQSSFGVKTLLSPDANNLPEVLNNLQGFRTRFEYYNGLIRQIFPQIKEVSVRPISEKEVKIFVLSQLNAARDDLAVPLQDSGTGIGQVLAILYVVLTAEFPRTIIIDEPQSFLHPGAIRRLFSILKQYPQHQYIVTTHSPIVINAADPQSLLLVRKQNQESTIEMIDRSQRQALETVLAEVGARLSDVFGADNILWVEGDTEELCFPLILSRICNQPFLGTVILKVIHTGDFDSKHSQTIYSIYDKLSKSVGLMPPAIGFIFDKEGRTQTVQDDFIRHSHTDQGRPTVFFTPRRMFENYLLNPEAIAWIMSQLDEFSNEQVSPDSIQAWIDHHRWENDLFKPKSRVPNLEKRTNELWLETVNGANVLQALFQHFSDKRYDYINDKKTYGIALTEWIVNNSPEDLTEIADLLMEALGREVNSKKVD